MVSKILDEIEKNHKFYYTIAYRYMKNHDDAQDALQSAYLRMVTKCPETLSPKKLRAWMAIVCSNESKTMLSTKKRLSRADHAITQESDAVSTFGNPQDLEFYYDDITYAALKIAPQEYQEPLFAYYKYSTPLLKLAREYGVPESNLRYWRKKVEKKLKEFL